MTSLFKSVSITLFRTYPDPGNKTARVSSFPGKKASRRAGRLRSTKSTDFTGLGDKETVPVVHRPGVTESTWTVVLGGVRAAKERWLGWGL